MLFRRQHHSVIVPVVKTVMYLCTAVVSAQCTLLSHRSRTVYELWSTARLYCTDLLWMSPH